MQVIFRCAVLICALASVAACTVSRTPPESKEQPIAVGWIQAAGEVRIYARKSDMNKLYDGSCISGVLTKGRTLPRKFRNRHVSVYGTLIDNAELEDLTAQGSSIGVENYCAGPKIAIIKRIELSSPGG